MFDIKLGEQKHNMVKNVPVVKKRLFFHYLAREYYESI